MRLEAPKKEVIDLMPIRGTTHGGPKRKDTTLHQGYIRIFNGFTPDDASVMQRDYPTGKKKLHQEASPSPIHHNNQQMSKIPS